MTFLSATLFSPGAEPTYQAKQIDPPPQEICKERPDRKPERSTLEFSASTSLLAKVEKRSEEGTEIAGKACQIRHLTASNAVSCAAKA
jgi:hypothetical protein